MSELVITTSDKDLLADIESAAIEGVIVNKKKRVIMASAIMTTTPADTSLANIAIYIGVNFTGGASAALFVNWLNERIKKKKANDTKINGVNCNCSNSEPDKNE